MSAVEADFRATYLAAVGRVAVNGQVRYKTSPNWSVIDKICSGYGYTFAADRVPASREVVYLNQGIATTTAANVGQGGLNPTRLAAMINPAGFRRPDLVIIAFGMNDRTDVAYVSNIEQITTAVLAAGADAIIVGPHQVNTSSASFTDETWHLLHRRLMECADRLGVAFLPAELFYAGQNRGYLGISDYSLTRANFANHPGPYEYRMLGEALANSFL
jgi:lysophospholipase L1-like esterase